MKKTLYMFIIAFMYPMAVCAQTHEGSTALHEMIIDINQGNYYKASQALNLASWQWDDEAILDLDSTICFLSYLHENKVKSKLINAFNLYFARTIIVYGNYYSQHNDNETAQIYYQYALLTRKKIWGAYSVKYSDSLNDFIQWCLRNGKDSISLQYCLEHKKVVSNVYGSNSIEYAYALNNLGIGYYQVKNYAKAEKYCLQSKQRKTKILGETHKGLRSTLHTLFYIYKAQGNYQQAIRNGIELLRTYQATSDTLNSEYIQWLSNVGSVCAEFNQSAMAEEYLLRSLSIHNSMSEEIDSLYANIVYALGTHYLEECQYDAAESYLNEALRVQKTIATSNFDVAMTLMNLGNVSRRLNKYSLAEQYLHEALQILRDDEPSNLFASIYNSLGNLYMEQQNIDMAGRCYLTALQVFQTVYGDPSMTFKYTDVLTNLGSYYSRIKEWDESEKYLLLALNAAISKQKYAFILGILGNLYIWEGQYAKAEKCLLQSLKIYEKLYSYANDYCIEALGLLGSLYEDWDQTDLAIRYYNAAIMNILSTYGYEHPKVSTYWKRLGASYIDKNQLAVAEMYYHKAQDVDAKRFESTLAYMSEKEREIFWNANIYSYEIVSPIIYYNLRHAAPAYDLQLFVKGLLQTSSTAISSSILESGDTLLISQWNNLKSLHEQINYLEKNQPSSPLLQSLRNDAESLEKKLVRSSSVYREQKNQLSLTWHDVQDALPDRSMAIEYMLVPGDTSIYCALVISSNDTFPVMIGLFTDKEVESILRQPCSTIYSSSDGQYLSELIWRPILPMMEDIDHVYISPVGLLHQLSLEAMPYDSISTMADHWDIQRLSSTRELVVNRESPSLTTASVYGGISYDVDTTNLRAASRMYDINPLLFSRGIEDDSINRGSVRYLPGTKKEADAIQYMLSTNHISSTLYSSIGANEESFKALSGKHNNLLHIGTHGFCWPYFAAQQKKYFAQNIDMDGNPTQSYVDPLNRCGLLFAGANMALSGHSKDLPQGVQDGILTAKEISLMDLRDCDLVVLSACETAKGDITSEGVFGLQRAFKLAGVQTIIMSLWPVNDNATQLLMTEFYRNWIVKHQSKHEAFKNAKNAVRSAKDDDGDYMYNSPEYWAGFIMLD